MRLRPSVRLALLVIGLIVAARPVSAQHPKVWLALPDQNEDYARLFSDTQSWAHAAQQTDVFSVGASYVSHVSNDVLKANLGSLGRLGLKLDVGMPALPVDKKVCGDGLEGMVWPGEPLAIARRLKAADIQIRSFSFDLPLTNGHISQAKNACRFSIVEVAARLALTMRALRSVYPHAKFVDVEVPTGMPAASWTQILSEWLDALRSETGEELYAFLMDIWWEFPWEQTARDSIRILHERGIQVGTFIDADRGVGVDADTFPLFAKRNACKVLGLALPTDFVVESNWLVPGVPILPEGDPRSLMALVNWYASGRPCPR